LLGVNQQLLAPMARSELGADDLDSVVKPAVKEKQRRLFGGFNGSVALSNAPKPPGLAVGVNNPPTALDPIHIKTRSGQMPGSWIIAASLQRRTTAAPPRQIGAGWNSGFVIHATDYSADRRHKLGRWGDTGPSTIKRSQTNTFCRPWSDPRRRRLRGKERSFATL
jgi:hypothetical protein